MPIAPRLKASTYILKYYTDAADALEQFKSASTGNDAAEYVLGARQALCSALREIHNDGEFWASLYGVSANIKASRSEIDRVLGDLEEFCKMEFAALNELDLPLASNVKLVTDLMTTISLMPPKPGLLEIEDLKRHVAAARDDLCQTRRRPGLWPFVRDVMHASVGVGGLVIVVANGLATTIEPVTAYGSIVAGTNIAIARFEAITKTNTMEAEARRRHRHEQENPEKKRKRHLDLEL